MPRIKLPSAAFQTHLESTLNYFRSERAWSRYWIHEKVREFYNRFPQQHEMLVIPVPVEAATGNFLEKGPWLAPFPHGYLDRLIERVRWRMVSYRINPVSNRAMRIFTDSWTSLVAPGADLLSRAHIKSARAKEILKAKGRMRKECGMADDVADYRRLFNVITGLSQYHASVLDRAEEFLEAMHDVEKARSLHLAKNGIAMIDQAVVTGRMSLDWRPRKTTRRGKSDVIVEAPILPATLPDPNYNRAGEGAV